MFLGFTHYTEQRNGNGTFIVWRITAKRRMAAKLKAIRRSFNVGSIIARPRLAHGSARLFRATTNTTLFRATRHSCASLLVAFAGCGELYSYVQSTCSGGVG